MENIKNIEAEKVTGGNEANKHGPYISEFKCNNCGICKNVCPENVIKFNGSHYEIYTGNCTCCGICISACPQYAIIMI